MSGKQKKLHNEWLLNRSKGIGASDAACILGLNPWKSNVKLWEEKTGRRPAEDIGDKPVVIYGKKSERLLRELFALDFPQYEVSYNEYGMIANLPECPWLFATLDGELTVYGDESPLPLIKRKGVLEIKTTEIQRSGDWKKWDNQVPDNYYIQVLHQLLATGYDFAILKAQIKWHKDGELQLSTRHYTFERTTVQEDMDYLLKEEIKFWECVKADRCPSLILPKI